jgi:hypothetical protein
MELGGAHDEHSEIKNAQQMLSPPGANQRLSILYKNFNGLCIAVLLSRLIFNLFTAQRERSNAKGNCHIKRLLFASHGDEHNVIAQAHQFQIHAAHLVAHNER